MVLCLGISLMLSYHGKKIAAEFTAHPLLKLNRAANRFPKFLREPAGKRWIIKQVVTCVVGVSSYCLLLTLWDLPFSPNKPKH